MVAERGHVSDTDLHALRNAGFGDAEIVEIVAHIGVNILTNCFNHIARTAIDFPVVSTGALKAA
jgi:alkylhydroperoxidase family enzyme